MKNILLAWTALVAIAPAHALDGKWTPAQVLEIEAEWLREQGLQLPPEQLWDRERGTGLLSGTVRIGGCSGAFVSDSGLIVTNHHCLFDLIQEHSSPQRDLIADGFLARTPAAELPSSTLRVEIPRRFSDVSAELLAAVPEGADPLARLEAIEVRQHELERACESRPDTKCKIAVFDEGVQYVLVETTELRDVRLVYAPPRAIGEYGGEIDNWMWPRHTGDFAIARVWVAADGRPADRNETNRPYQPEFYFPISQRGLDIDEFVMVLGYPGVTYRALIAEEMAERRDRYFVRREQVFGELIEILEQAGASDEAAAIALAGNLKGLQNRYKNAQGQIAGLDRGRIVARQREQDDRVASWAKANEQHSGALQARAELRQIANQREASWERDFLLKLIGMGVESAPGSIPPMPKALYFGATLAHLAREQLKPENERGDGFSDDDLPKLRDRLRREQQNFHQSADQRVFAALLRRALALPETQRIGAVDAAFGKLDPAQLEQKIATLYAGSSLLDAQAREDMLGLDIDALRARQDPLLAFGIAWNDELQAMRDRDRQWDSRSAIYRPVWRRAIAAQAGKPIAPDANSTLRVSFAHVQGYAPRDGVFNTPFTTLSGALDKHTGLAPFDLPQALREAAADPGKRWQQASLGDVPIDFLADADTSGGNSGSPVINGHGELVGVNFDRVWENVAGDFGFNPALSRNVSVDIRYMLWLLDRVEQANELLLELGIKQ